MHSIHVILNTKLNPRKDLTIIIVFLMAATQGEKETGVREREEQVAHLHTHEYFQLLKELKE